MACFYPLAAYQTAAGEIIFSDRGDCRPLNLPCGQCIGCRLDKSRTWAMRCVHEASLHDDNCFITLTYSDDNMPFDAGLRHRDYQLFMKRLREKYAPRTIKFFQCGEYGDRNNRPHYHAILFNHNFDDWVYLFDSPSGSPVYTSPTLESLWKIGFVTIGTVTFESAAYIARYCLKKLNGKLAEVINERTGLKHYERVNWVTGEITDVVPEYSTMSRGGRRGRGIGYDWLIKHRSDVYPKDFTTVRNIRMRPPKYYDQLLKHIDVNMYDDIKGGRAKLIQTLAPDNTEQRLAAREEVKVAQFNQLKRSL